MALTFRIMFLGALVTWLGEIIFFSFVVAPTMFAMLPVDAAGRLAAVLLRRYYGIGIGAGCVLLVSMLGMAPRACARRRFVVGNVLVTGMLAMTLYAAAVIQPRSEALRRHLRGGTRPQAEAQAEFDRLHRRAVQLNGLTLLCGLGVLGAAAGMLRE